MSFAGSSLINKLRLTQVATCLWLAAIGTCTAATVGLAVLRVRQIFNPIPVWDLWRGYLGFYERISAGDWRAWFDWHYEHRIILGRIFFWMDIRWFRGATLFLVIVNLILMALIACVFWWILRKLVSDSRHRTLRLGLGLIVTSLIFLLCQGENVYWGFQGVLWLSYLLPLLAFCLAAWPSRERSEWIFVLCCILGVAAVGTMANGLLTLPLLGGYLVIVRRDLKHGALAIMLAAVIIYLYFSDASMHVKSGIEWHLSHIFEYFLVLIGAPIVFILKPLGAGIGLAAWCGLVCCVLLLFQAVSSVVRGVSSPLSSALLFYALYVLLALFSIAALRPEVQNPIFGHYTTIPILAWMCLISLYASDIAALPRPGRAALAIAALLVLVSAVKAQSTMRDSWDEPVSDRRATILGLALGVVDPVKIAQIIGEFPIVPPIAERAYRQNLSLFGWYPYRGSREDLGRKFATTTNLPACQGSIQDLKVVSDLPQLKERPSDVFRIDGHIESLGSERKVKAVRVLNAAGVEVGYAITGQGTQSDSFRGYVFHPQAGPAILHGEDQHGPICQMNSAMPIRGCPGSGDCNSQK